MERVVITSSPVGATIMFICSCLPLSCFLMQALQREASRLPVNPTVFRTIERRLERVLSRASRESRWEQEESKHSELGYQEAGWTDKCNRADFVKREALKNEGVIVGDAISRRNVDRVESKALAGSECLDVLNGVSTRRGNYIWEGLHLELV